MKKITERAFAVFTIQETHFKKKGKLKVENFEIFESIRKKEKGGTVVGAHKSLNPILCGGGLLKPPKNVFLSVA